MSIAIDKYLDRVMAYADLREPGRAEAVREELRGHLQDKVRALTQSGTPIEDAIHLALERLGDARTVGYQYRPKFPLLDVRVRGTARGVIAVGPRAVGVFAFGGVAIGLFAFGGLAVGLVSWGGLAAALLWAWGGMTLSTGVAMGGLAIGTLAMGGLAIGVAAVGGMAVGGWAAGANTTTMYLPEQAPEFVRQSVHWLPMNETELTQSTLILMPMFMALLALHIKLTMRERRRLERLDPQIAD
jgi:hypothetical protein